MKDLEKMLMFGLAILSAGFCLLFSKCLELSLLCIAALVELLCLNGILSAYTQPKSVRWLLTRASIWGTFVFMAVVLALLVACGFCNVSTGIALSWCIVSMMVLLCVNGILPVSSHRETVALPKLELFLASLIMLFVYVWGPVFFLAHAKIWSEACIAFGAVSNCMAIISMAFFIDTKIMRKFRMWGRGSCWFIDIVANVLALVLVVSFNADGKWATVYGGAMGVSLLVLGILVWLNMDMKSLVKYKQLVLFPFLSILLLIEVVYFCLCVRKIPAIRSARQESVRCESLRATDAGASKSDAEHVFVISCPLHFSRYANIADGVIHLDFFAWEYIPYDGKKPADKGRLEHFGVIFAG